MCLAMVDLRMQMFLDGKATHDEAMRVLVQECGSSAPDAREILAIAKGGSDVIDEG